MKKMWMVRCGPKSIFIDDFIKDEMVAIGWVLGDLSDVNENDLTALIDKNYPENSKISNAQIRGMVWNFVHNFKIGDYVVTYDAVKREYYVGKIISDYKYIADIDNTELINQRDVKWFTKTIPRDNLPLRTKNKLGSLLTVFSLNDVQQDILDAVEGKAGHVNEEDEEDEAEQLKEDIFNQSFELIKDSIMKLGWEDMQELVAGLLRAMGYKTIVSHSGPDKGKDIIASPDGLGLEDPKILVEVKHRTSSTMGAPQIRNFMGVLQGNTKGLYVSTGGFTKEAEYEAERSNNQITLMDSDLLVQFILQYYDNFDNDARNLIPLKKLYWPIK